MITRKRVLAEKAAKQFRTRTRDVIESALVGDGDGNVEVTGRAGWVWVRLNGSSDDVAQALNRSAADLVEDAAVDLRRVRRYAASYYEIVGPSNAVVYDVLTATGNATNGVKKHAPQHLRADAGAGGSDPVDVYARMVVPLRAREQDTPDLTLYVEAGLHAFGYWEGGDSPAFVPPTAFADASRVDLLYLGNDNDLHILEGTATGYGAALSYPAVPTECVPVAYVRVDKNATALTETEVVRDARMLSSDTGATSLPPSGAAGGDLSGTYPNPSVTDDSHAHTSATLSGVQDIIVDTKANILARTGDTTGQWYLASDTQEIYAHIGSNLYYKVPFALVSEPSAPDMGYTQGSSRIGYGTDYVTDKLLANVQIGGNAKTTLGDGDIRVSSSVLQAYLSGEWKDVVTGFRLREDDSGYLVFEHKPTGMSEWLEINSGNSNTLGLNGLPMIQQYGASMGAYPAKLQVDGGTF